MYRKIVSLLLIERRSQSLDSLPNSPPYLFAFRFCTTRSWSRCHCRCRCQSRCPFPDSAESRKNFSQICLPRQSYLDRSQLLYPTRDLSCKANCQNNLSTLIDGKIRLLKNAAKILYMTEPGFLYNI